MPSSVVHSYIGLDTVNKLNNDPKLIINKRLNNFKVYCQSMDILYFYHIFLIISNKVIDLGHKYHSGETFNTFNLLIQDNKENKDNELFTLIAGLLTHYIADSHIHPYVNSFIGRKETARKFNKHFEIETFLDNYFIKEKMHIDPKTYNNTDFIFNYTKEDIIEIELNKLFENIYNYPNMGKKYYRALKEMKFFFNYLRYDKYGIKKILYKILDINPFSFIPRLKYLSYHFDPNQEEYLNLMHNTWINPVSKEESNKSFFDLYQEVVDESSYIINELYDYIYKDKDVDLKRLIKNNSYANGEPLSPNK